MPSSPESEQTVLGLILLDNLHCEEARRDLRPEWFYSEAHRNIYLAILALHEAKEIIDTVTLSDELSKNGSNELIALIPNLIRGLPLGTKLKPYITRIKESARRRWLIKFSAKLEAEARNETENEDSIFSRAIEQLDRVRQFKSEKRKPQTLEELAEDQLLRYELFFKGVSDALPTGFPDIDNHLLGGGFVPSALYVLAAGTSRGKTSLALDITANVAETGHRVYVVSREMSREAIYDRLVAVEGDIARWKLRPGIYETEYKQAKQAVINLTMKPVVIDDVSTNLADVRGYLREHERKAKVELLVIDYLQLMDAARKDSRAQEVASISRGLKGMAMEFRIPILALSQLSRKHMGERREPELHDLKESGEIENDADAVFFLFGDAPEEGMKFFSRTLKCAKQREGALFRADLPFNGELITYRRPRTETVGGIS
jgi:replicative DNA helicase